MTLILEPETLFAFHHEPAPDGLVDVHKTLGLEVRHDEPRLKLIQLPSPEWAGIVFSQAGCGLWWPGEGLPWWTFAYIPQLIDERSLVRPEAEPLTPELVMEGLRRIRDEPPRPLVEFRFTAAQWIMWQDGRWYGWTYPDDTWSGLPNDEWMPSDGSEGPGLLIEELLDESTLEFIRRKEGRAG